MCSGAEECGHGTGAGQPAGEESGDTHHQAFSGGTEGLRQGIVFTVLTHHSGSRVCIKVNSQIRILMKVKSRTRICINVMRIRNTDSTA